MATALTPSQITAADSYSRKLAEQQQFPEHLRRFAPVITAMRALSEHDLAAFFAALNNDFVGLVPGISDELEQAVFPMFQTKEAVQAYKDCVQIYDPDPAVWTDSPRQIRDAASADYFRPWEMGK